jgi:phosphatidylglycerophosphate synthase
MVWPISADAVTALRLVITPVFIACVIRAQAAAAVGWVAGALFAVAAWSDIADGRIARRLGTASDRGRILDHFADIAFILGALGTFVSIGVAPWWVPASIATAFSVYVVDSWIRTAPVKPTLIGSRLGHVGGIANYVLIGVLVFNDSAALHWLPPAFVQFLFTLVPLYSGAGIAVRFLASRV